MPNPANPYITGNPVGDNPQSGGSNYLDFELEIGPGRGREYPVAVLHSPAGTARATMRFPFEELALENRILNLQNVLLRSGGRRRAAPSDEERAVQNFGQALFDALLSGEILARYDASLQEAARQDKGLRLKLRILPPELGALPWEFMYDQRQAEYVCLSRLTPIVRYLESPHPIRPLTVTPPLRILGMVASPRDQLPLDVKQEQQRVGQAIQGLQARGLVELEWLPGQTWQHLQQAMWRGPWHVFHFIGHGGFDAHSQEGFIVLADDKGQTHRLSAIELGRLLDHPALRLALLNSCEGARGSERDIFSSAASILMRRNIPAVLAMQYKITEQAAIELARVFYEALACGMAVDEAVVAARQAISLAVTNSVEWGAPVLYMRAPDGVLFQMTEMPPAAAPPPPEADAERERLEQLYLDGLDAFWVEEWDKAARSFQTIVAQRPDYQDAVARLQEAERQRDLARLYAQALTARQAEDWPGARAALEKLTAQAPDFKDAAALLATARKQAQLADLYAQAQKLHRAGRWQAVVNVFDQIAALEPDYADAEGLLAAARREIEAERRRAELRDLYRRAVLAIDGGQWEAARQLLRQVQEQEPGYRETERLLARAEAEARLQNELATLYAAAARLLRAGQYRAALDKWDQVRARDPQYPDRDKVHATARQKLADAARVAPPKDDIPPAPLPAWSWRVAGGAAVLLAALVIAIGATLWLLRAMLFPTPTLMPTPTGAPRPPTPTPLPTLTPTPTPFNATMVYVPAGDFLMGSAEADSAADDDEKPLHSVYLDAFWIDQTEVTNAQYRACVAAGSCAASECADNSAYNGDQQPVVCVDWSDAMAYCAWAGARLPTEAEWEKAARGADGRIYPWGNAFDGARLNFCDRNCEFEWKDTDVDDGYAQTAPVGSYPAGASPYGALDMAGNVWEWTSSLYEPYPYDPADGREDAAAGGVRVVRGGSWDLSVRYARAAYRYCLDPAYALDFLGLRCARSVSEP